MELIVFQDEHADVGDTTEIDKVAYGGGEPDFEEFSNRHLQVTQNNQDGES